MSVSQRTIDLNADLGERFGVWRLGDDEAMLRLVTSANIARGLHAILFELRANVSGGHQFVRAGAAAAAERIRSQKIHVGHLPEDG